jgi:hypothetical protein
MKVPTRLVSAVAVVSLAFAAGAQTPELINYQGRLVDGTNLVQGAVPVVFRFFTAPAGGGAMYAETQTVTVVDGLYATQIGQANPVPGALASALTNSPLYLELEVNGQALSPRERVAAVAYALLAESVRAGGITAAMISDGAVTGAKIQTGAIGNDQISASAGISGSKVADVLLQDGSRAMTGALTVSNSLTVTGSLALGGQTRSTWPAELPATAHVLSKTAVNSNLTAAGFMLVNDLGESWTLATNAAAWSARDNLAVVSHDGKMWVLGGRPLIAGVYTNDVWFSTDGASWSLATNAAPWTRRHSPVALVYDGKMWVQGGVWSGGSLNDVWYSSNGVAWIQATAAAGWAARQGHAGVVYAGKMWMLGGLEASSIRHNDVWHSTNGVTWTQATNAAGWSARYAHAAVVHDGKMWIMGGHDGAYRNDVWWSTDGVVWTEAVAPEVPRWIGRNHAAVLAIDGKMWLMGGDISSVRLHDVWCSSNGAHWKQATDAAGWSTRSMHGALTHDGRLWVLGGWDPSLRNDVWFSQTATTVLGRFYLFEKQ